MKNTKLWIYQRGRDEVMQFITIQSQITGFALSLSLSLSWRESYCRGQDFSESLEMGLCK